MDIAVVGFKFTYSVSEKNKVINPYAIRKNFKPQKRKQKS